MTTIHRTIFFEQHVRLGAKLVEFGGWEMPIQYNHGILEEHMATREKAGVFDVSHLGRIIFKGKGAIDFLQHVLTNNAEELSVGKSQYTLIQNENGGAFDDAYLYKVKKYEYLLVVNASNREKDLAHLGKIIQKYPDVMMNDKTFDLAMISLQGPLAMTIMKEICGDDATLPKPGRNNHSILEIMGSEVMVARTGYTGETIGFELFVKNKKAHDLWDFMIEKGATPIGLGARDTLRLESCLPLYGHELGVDQRGREIPVFASKLSKFAVSFSDLKGDFIGKQALLRQQLFFEKIIEHDYSDISGLPEMIMPLAITGKGIAREGHKVFREGKPTGYVTSGTSVPYRFFPEENSTSSESEGKIKTRPIALALIRSDIRTGDTLEIEIRNKRCDAVVVSRHM